MVCQFAARPKWTASPSGSARHQTPKRNHAACENVRNDDSTGGVDAPLQQKINKMQDTIVEASVVMLSKDQLVCVLGTCNSVFEMAANAVQRAVLCRVNLIKTTAEPQDSSDDDPDLHGIGASRKIRCDNVAEPCSTRHIDGEDSLSHVDGSFPDLQMSQAIPLPWDSTHQMDVVVLRSGRLAPQNHLQHEIKVMVFKVGVTTNVALGQVLGQALAAVEISEKGHGDGWKRKFFLLKTKRRDEAKITAAISCEEIGICHCGILFC